MSKTDKDSTDFLFLTQENPSTVYRTQMQLLCNSESQVHWRTEKSFTMGTKKNHQKRDLKAKTISGKKFSFQKLSLSKYVILIVYGIRIESISAT